MFVLEYRVIILYYLVCTVLNGGVFPSLPSSQDTPAKTGEATTITSRNVKSSAKSANGEEFPGHILSQSNHSRSLPRRAKRDEQRERKWDEQSCKQVYGQGISGPGTARSIWEVLAPGRGGHL